MSAKLMIDKSTEKTLEVGVVIAVSRHSATIIVKSPLACINGYFAMDRKMIFEDNAWHIDCPFDRHASTKNHNQKNQGIIL